MADRRDAAQGGVAIERFHRPADAIDFATVRRVLVVTLRHHGDVLLTSPLYTVLRGVAPKVEIDALVYRETVPVIAFNPELAAIHAIDREWKKQGPIARFRSERQLLSTLKARTYDLVIHLTGHRRGAWLVRALKPRHSVAPRLVDESGIVGMFWKSTFTHRYANASSVGSGAALGRRHMVEQNLDALRRLGVSIDKPPKLTMVAGSDGEIDARSLLIELGVEGPYIAMQPTSRWFFKCWSVERNAALIARLLARGETIVLSCAPDERERAMLTAIAAAVLALPGVPVERMKLADDGSLNRLAAIIARAKLFIGIDSAPMHIAAAVGTPTVALFGPSGEFNWGPWQVANRVVTSDAYPCRPCGQDGCGGGKLSDCLATLPVHAVLAAIDDLMAEVDAKRDPLGYV
jgi:heptosyltransferase-3